MAHISTPAATMGMLAPSAAMISPSDGRCGRARNSSDSSSERRTTYRNGTMADPITNGMRQPQSAT